MRQVAIMSSSVFAASILLLGVAAATKIVDYRSDAAADASAIDNIVKGRASLAFESHYNKQFPAKTFGTNVWAAIDYLLLGEGRPGVVVGQNDWLYTDEEFKTYADAERQVQAHLALIGWVRQELERRGSQLAIALIPSKTRVYPEHLGSRQPAQIHADLYPRIQRHLEQAGIAQADLLAALTRAKSQPVFLRTDTHWTPYGAQVAAQDVARALSSAGLAGSGSVAYTTHDEKPQQHKGDLFSFLPLDPYFSRLLPPHEDITVQRTEAPAGAAEPGEADLFGDSQAPQVALVGTSYSANPLWNFTGALQQALREDVVNYAQQGKGPFVAMLDYLSRQDLPATAPRVVLWELPERFFPVGYDLSAYHALLPAELAAQNAVTASKPKAH